MKYELRFRGKVIEDSDEKNNIIKGSGCYIDADGKQFIICDSKFGPTFIMVEAIQRSTGIFDKNGPEIFEGDRVKKYWNQGNDNGYVSYLVKWDFAKAGFNITAKKGKNHYYEIQ